MAKERKATLVCRPCGTRVVVSDLGAAVVECYECGVELEPEARAAKALPAKAAKAAPKKAAPKKAAPKAARKPAKAAPKKAAAKPAKKK